MRDDLVAFVDLFHALFHLFLHSLCIRLVHFHLFFEALLLLSLRLQQRRAVQRNLSLILDLLLQRCHLHQLLIDLLVLLIFDAFQLLTLCAQLAQLLLVGLKLLLRLTHHLRLILVPILQRQFHRVELAKLVLQFAVFVLELLVSRIQLLLQALLLVAQLLAHFLHSLQMVLLQRVHHGRMRRLQITDALLVFLLDFAQVLLALLSLQLAAMQRLLGFLQDLRQIVVFRLV
mmetsp:Transcript_51568/g.82249  ORF Transcript_51568/g.82249 Transcript_51568/m.82249 type:complete len:231 (+) Transcript_51568:408-1100(+)